MQYAAIQIYKLLQVRANQILEFLLLLGMDQQAFQVLTYDIHEFIGI